MSTIVRLKTDPSILLPILKMWEQETNPEDFSLDLDESAMTDDLRQMVESEDADILLLQVEDKIVGMVGLILFKSPLSEQRLANEHYYYVLPRYRKGKNSLKLLTAAEKWAVEKGCTHLILNASMLASGLCEKVCRLYERKDYKLFEKSYIKKVG